MATAVSICSNALLRLGADSFNSFDEGNETGDNIERVRVAANLWPTVRARVLRSHTWNCAIKRVALAPSVDTPAFGYVYQFAKPGDWLRTVAVGRDSEGQTAYRMEGGFFLCDDAEFYLVYVYDNDNPATYDATLIEALELEMAAALCYPVTKSASLVEGLKMELREVMRRARGLDTADEPAETLGDFPLYASRFGARGPR